jgi:hypothetical protein
VSCGSQFLDPPLHLRVGTKAEQRLSALAVKALLDSRKEALQSSLRCIGRHNQKNKIARFQVKLADGVEPCRLPECRPLGPMVLWSVIECTRSFLTKSHSLGFGNPRFDRP